VRHDVAGDREAEGDTDAVSIDDHVGYCNECGAEYRGIGVLAHGLCPGCVEKTIDTSKSCQQELDELLARALNSPDDARRMFACVAILSRASIDTRRSLDGVREAVESLTKAVALLAGEDVESLMRRRVH
jgi:hypothetical protein